MTRTRDTLIALDDRGRIANEAHGDLFISIHVNAANPNWKDRQRRAASRRTSSPKRRRRMRGASSRWKTNRCASRPIRRARRTIRSASSSRHGAERAPARIERAGGDDPAEARPHAPGPEPRGEAGRLSRARHGLHARRARRDRVRDELRGGARSSTIPRSSARSRMPSRMRWANTSITTSAGSAAPLRDGRAPRRRCRGDPLPESCCSRLRYRRLRARDRRSDRSGIARRVRHESGEHGAEERRAAAQSGGVRPAG